MSIDILKRTNDGNDLEPSDLNLIQSCINGGLTEEGEIYFQKLYNSVLSLKYQKPFLCGIENITRDHEGYIYWKEKQIEHFTFSIMSYERVKNECLELKRRCEILEYLGQVINTGSVIWQWKD